ncbi:MAG: LysM peptidoglycan-binding domain-containing protein [Polyangiaceae bacterium]|nr:LysM peptidoglycan-binding domain-containing protein [Polyangiaceae bacterium]
MPIQRTLAFALSLFGLLGIAADAAAFPHVVKPGETLAFIAERVYGRVEMERLLVAANGLDIGGGSPIVAGMRIEIPATSHHRVSAGETWASLATEYLGAPDRGDVLAISNDAMPWIEPSIGQEIRVPFNLRHIAGSNESTLAIAYKYTGDRDKAWMLDKYNRLKGKSISRGDVILVPLWDLSLSEAGKLEAQQAGAVTRSEALGRAREAQKKAETEIVALLADVRHGRYTEAVARGNRTLGLGELSKPQTAAVLKALTEAYVALDADSLAAAACAGFREADPSSVLDPVEVSPKIISACTLGILTTPPAAAPTADAGADGGTDAGKTNSRGKTP